MKHPKNLTQQELETLQKLSEDFFTVEECAIALEVSPEHLRNEIINPNSEAHKYYYKGRITELAKHRRNVKELANRGSNPAQVMVEKFIEQSNIKP